MKNLDIDTEINKSKDKIVRELNNGNDIMIKKTPTGIKIESLKIKRIDTI